MYVHTRERDIRPGFDGVKIKFLLLLLLYIHCAKKKTIKIVDDSYHHLNYGVYML